MFIIGFPGSPDDGSDEDWEPGNLFML